MDEQNQSEEVIMELRGEYLGKIQIFKTLFEFTPLEITLHFMNCESIVTNSQTTESN